MVISKHSIRRSGSTTVTNSNDVIMTPFKLGLEIRKTKRNKQVKSKGMSTHDRLPLLDFFEKFRSCLLLGSWFGFFRCLRAFFLPFLALFMTSIKSDRQHGRTN